MLSESGFFLFLYQILIMNCSVCNSGDVAFVCKVNGFDTYRCQNCGLIFTSPIPNDRILDEFYQGFLFNKPDLSELKSKIPSKKKELLKTIRLAEQDCKGKSFLDYGGGTGLTYAAAKSCGFESYYYDIDKQAIQFTIDNLGLQPEYIISNSETDLRKFDVIMCDNVIEHIKQPDELLRLLFGKLADGGILIIKTPRASNTESIFIFSVWGLVYFKKALYENSIFTALKSIFIHRYWHAEPPRHLFSFSDKSMKILAKEVCGNGVIIDIDSYEMPFLRYSLGYVLLHISNPFLLILVLLILSPLMLIELPIFILKFILVKTRLVSLAGMIVKIQK